MLVQALTTGHEGSLSTLHASSPEDALRRLVTLALMGDVDLPHRAVAEQVASAVDLVVHQARGADGQRRVVEVAAVYAGEEGPRSRPLVRWRATGRSAGGIDGHFDATPERAAWRREVERDAALAGAA